MKKRIAIFLVAAAAAAFGAWAATWTDPDTGYTWTYQINGDMAEIYRRSYSAAISPSPTGAVTIPAALGGKPVTSIGSCAFSGCSGLTSVTIPNSVTSIRGSAFYGCSGLTSVTIPDSVTNIGESAFYGCSGLTSVTMPASVTSIGDSAFSGCSGLTSVTIGNGVTSIGDFAFYNCSGLTSVTIPNSVTNIGYYAFRGCSGLTSVRIGDGVTSIEQGAFCDCRGLTAFAVGSGNPAYKAVSGLLLTKDGKELVAVAGVNGKVTIPDSVTSIGSSAFSWCSGLTSVTIPNSVTSIGYDAFYGCSGLTSVTIPGIVTNIGYSAFSGCSGLTSVTIPDSVTSIGDYAFYGCSGLTSVTIGNGVTSIGDYAFRGCSGLTSVTIPDSVTSIGDYAFSGCNGLTSVTIPGGVTNIGRYAFNNCTNITSLSAPFVPSDLDASRLTSVTIPNSVTNIGPRAFYNCSGLTSVTIPNSVTSIGYDAFYGCSGLTSVTIPASVTSIGSSAFYGCSGLTSVTIPNSVTSIKYSAFSDCSGLTSVTIPDSVTNIGESAFYGCSGLTSVTIPASVTSIGDSAFSGCSGLTSVTIGNGVTSIGDDAFYGCSGLTSVTIGNGVTSIGSYVFYNCTNVTDVVVPGWKCTIPFDAVTNLVISDGTTSIGDSAFSGCSGLTSVTIPDSVTSIGAFAFDGCSGLTSITIPDSVTSIGSSAFSGCRGLTSVAIPDSVTSIGGGAFSGCSGLTSVTIPGSVTNIGFYVFEDCGIRDLTVPQCALDLQIRKLLDYWEDRSVTNVSFSSVITNIGDMAFSELRGLESVIIPDGVMSIGTSAFSGCSGLASVRIPDSVTYIGDWAFAGCSGLASVRIPDSVTYIGDWAFAGCSALTDVSVSDSVMAIGDGAFHGCVGLADADGFITIRNVLHGYVGADENVIIPDSVISIGEEAFRNCDSITNVVIPASVTNIGESAFAYCDNLKSCKVPCNVTRIGSQAFEWCTHLYNVAMPDVFKGIPREEYGYEYPAAVYYYKPHQMVTFDVNGGTVPCVAKSVDYGLRYGTLPEPLRTGYSFVGWMLYGHVGEAWDYGNEYRSISSESFVTEIADHTLVAQWQINQYEVSFDANGGTGGTTKTQNYGTSLSAPTVTRTGYTFTGWSPSVPSTMPAGNKTYTAQWQINQYTVTFDANGGTGGKSGKQNYGSAIVAPTVTREWFNFMGWSPAVAATVPTNNVTYTAQWARWGDTISASKMGGKTMKQLYPSDYARMTTVVLEEGITELPVGFFDGCDKVESVTWPSTLVEFGKDAMPPKFLQSLSYDANGFMIYNGWILDYKNRGAEAVTIPNGVVGIGRRAFAEMFDLETVTMPESLKYIASGAFEDCSWIQNLQFMSGLRYVGPEAFRNCSSLLGASFADGVEQIGANAFYGCWQMQSVRLPFTVTSIGSGAFAGCSAIRGVTVPTHVMTMQSLFPAAYAKIESAEVAEGETTVMDSMFAGCVALSGGATQTDMSMIPNTVTNIGARAFQGCTSLTAFVVPDSVTTLGASVFQGCTALWNVTLSRSLTEIPDYAFYGCSKLETMTVPASVSHLGNRFFSGNANPAHGQNALYYLCINAPSCHSGAYAAIAGNMTTYVLQDSRSWDGRQGSRVLPQSWNGYPITYWTPLRFDVTFDANGGRFDSSGGSTRSEQQIKDMTYALPSTEPVRPGWAFEGWWTEQTGGAEVRYTTRVTATRTHTLYAHWRSLGNTMTVTFNSNGGTVVTPGKQDYVPGQTFGQFPVPTRRGYTFEGWWTESVNGILMTEATAVPAADMELFAHWKPITYYVRFHANGGKGTMPDEEFTYDVRDVLDTHEFTRAGFAFTGWATTPSGQVRYAENATVVNLEEVQDKIVDLYAVWSGVGYSVRFDSNGGTGVMDNQTIAVGETQNLWPCVFARAGYAFAGWALSPTDAEAKKVKYRDGAAVRNLATASGAVVPLYAVWAASGQTVRITFNPNGGSVSPDYWNCVVGTAVEAFPTPTRPGYTFAGWWTAKTGGTRVTSIARVASAQTLYAHWTPNGGVDPGDGSVTVTFNGNGGSVKETKRTVASGSAVGTLPTPTRTGYAFAGWWTAANGGTQVSTSTKVASSVTYYAQWLPLSAVRMEGGAKGTATHRTDAKTGVTTFTAKAGDKSSLFAYWLGPDGGKAGFGTTLKVADVDSEGQYVAVFRTKADCAKPTLDANAAFAAGGATMANAVVGVAAGDRFAVPEKCHPATFKASGLPKGLKVDATGGAITGVPTKAGRYTAKVTVTSKANSKWKTTVKVPITIAALPEWAVGQFKGTVSGAAATMSIGSTGKVSGKFTLAGQSWTFSAASFAADSDADGSPVRLACRATAKTTAKVGGKKTTVSRTLAFALVADPATSGIAAKTVDGAFGDGGAVAFCRVAGLGVTRTGVAAGGTVSLSKAYGQAASGAKVKAAAKLKKGYTFAGWTVRDAAGNDVTAQYVANPLALAVTLTMPGEDLFLEAEFMKEADALAAASLDWDPALAVGFAYKGAPAVTGPAAYKVLSVTGLPKGLAWKKGVVSGTPTVATVGKVAKVKVGLSTNAKKTRTFSVPLVVAALPAFAVGSFEGGSETAGAENRTTLSITSAGKISGKIAYANATWTASAAGFTSKTADGLFATLTLKNGKKKGTEEICISSLGVVTASRFTARQLLWTTDDTWKGWAAKLVADARAGVEFTNALTGVVATFGKNGVATGVLKVGKSTFTAKATLVPTAIDEHNLEGVLYFSFPANSKKKFKGLVCPVGVEVEE